MRGQTPELFIRARSHEKVSGIGALVVSPRRKRINLYLSLHPDQNIHGPQVIRFLKHLRRHPPGPSSCCGTWDAHIATTG